MPKYADILLKSNCVFTAAGEEPFAGFVAIADGKILSVGKDSCEGLVGPDTAERMLGTPPSQCAS